MLGALKDRGASMAWGHVASPHFSWSPRHWCAPCRPARERSQAAAVIRLTQTFPSGCSSEE